MAGMLLFIYFIMENAQKYEVENWSKALNIPYNPELGNTQSYFVALNRIKDFYTLHMKDIIAFNKENPTRLYDMYFDWGMLLNPIEYEAWSVMRNKGYMPFYPQFPVANRFIDFGNPVLKLGIEIDGKDYHDLRADEIRDEILKKETGWDIVRIPAAKMIKNNFEREFKSSCWAKCSIPDNFNCSCEANIIEWLRGTGDGILEAVKVQYFNGSIYMPDYRKDWFLNQCDTAVRSHMSTRWVMPDKK